jgi:hypothetical protein
MAASHLDLKEGHKPNAQITQRFLVRRAGGGGQEIETALKCCCT